MQVAVNRLFKSSGVISIVEINSEIFSYGLEILNPIPAGKYPLTWYLSPSHNIYRPLVNNVPNHSGIEIHVANTIADLKGCLGLGSTLVSKDFIGSSTEVVNRFYTLFKSDVDKGLKSYITYKDFI